MHNLAIEFDLIKIIQIMSSPSPANSHHPRNEEAIQALEEAHQISSFLRCGIDKNTLAIMINMVESGCKPEHVAAIVAEIKQKTGHP